MRTKPICIPFGVVVVKFLLCDRSWSIGTFRRPMNSVFLYLNATFNPGDCAKSTALLFIAEGSGTNRFILLNCPFEQPKLNSCFRWCFIPVHNENWCLLQLPPFTFLVQFCQLDGYSDGPILMWQMWYWYSHTNLCDLEYVVDLVFVNKTLLGLQVFFDLVNDRLGMFDMRFALSKCEILL